MTLKIAYIIPFKPHEYVPGGEATMYSLLEMNSEGIR